MKKSHLFVTIIAIALLVAPPSFAATFSWTPGNTGIVTNTDLLQLTVGGITATVQAFTAEKDATLTDAIVVGPWPTQVGANNPGFGVDVRGLGEQLGLIADDSLIPTARGTDIFSGGLSPGFSSGYGNDTVPNPAHPALHFALFSFDQPVNIPAVTVDDVVNSPRAVWLATGTSAPDFSGGFLAGLASFNVLNSADDPASDGLFTHSLGATGVTQLLVGAPPRDMDLGPLTALPFGQGSNFFIDSFDATIVPVPAAVWLFGSGLLGLIGMARRKKA